MTKNTTYDSDIFIALAHSELRDILLQTAKYLSSRERTSTTTDISQMISVMRNQMGFDVDRPRLVSLFESFEQACIGQIQNVGGRKKFKWFYWMIPKFNIKDGSLKDVTFVDMDEFKKDKNLYKRISEQVKRVATIEFDREQKAINESLSKVSSAIDVLQTDNNVSKRNLNFYSLEDLLIEIESRGWEITLNRAKSRSKEV